MNKDILLKLQESAEFRSIIADLEAFRPVVPKWHPSLTADSAQELLDSIKLATGEQRGFDLVVAILIGKKGTGNG